MKDYHFPEREKLTSTLAWLLQSQKSWALSGLQIIWLYVTPLCETPAVQISLSFCVRCGDKIGTFLREAPVLWSPVSRHLHKNIHRSPNNNKIFEETFQSIFLFRGKNRSLSPCKVTILSKTQFIILVNTLTPAAPYEIFEFWLMVISWFSLG